MDLPAVWDLTTAAEGLRVSALTRSGIPESCAAVSGGPVGDPPRDGAAVPFTERLFAGVETAYRLLKDGKGDEAKSLRSKASEQGPV